MARAAGRLTLTRVVCWVLAIGLGPDLAAFIWQFPWGPWALGFAGGLAAEVAWDNWRYWRHIDQRARDDF